MDDKLTLLTDKQIWGDDQGKGQLQVMNDYGTKTGMSDLAILLGGLMGSDGATTSNGQRTGFIWSASSNRSGAVQAVDQWGYSGAESQYERLCGVRPVLPSWVTSLIKSSESKPSRKFVNVVEYGEYPQTIADEEVTRELEEAFSKGQLQKTGKTYTFDAEELNADNKPFRAKKHIEYQHKGKRYISVVGRGYDEDSVLSNGVQVKVGEEYWVEVQPIEWLIDQSNVWVARQALVAGVQFDNKQGYDGNFANTAMNQYLKNHFAKEMMVGRDVGVTPEAETPTTRIAEREAPTTEKALDAKKKPYRFKDSLKNYAEKEAIREQLGRRANGGNGRE